MKPTIIVITYNRPDSLRRLLRSMEMARYQEHNVDLVISIDYQDSAAHNEVIEIANNFNWIYGAKKIIVHQSNLGLRAHVLSCGDLVHNFGSIIMLEDDLFLSADFYAFATNALEFYQDDKQIGGISLYNHKRNFNNSLPFDLLGESADVYFLQIASSWGQAWTKNQWTSFRDWYAENSDSKNYNDLIPNSIASWPETSWLKYYIKYLAATNRYFVYPTISFTSNFGDSGTHNKRNNANFQVPISITGKSEFNFIPLESSVNVYDSFFELNPSIVKELNKSLGEFDFSMDLYGLKDLSKFRHTHAISSKKTKENAESIKQFGLNLKPMSMNVIYSIEGDYFSLSAVKNFENATLQKKPDYEEWMYFFAPVRLKIMFKVLLKELKQKFFSRS